MSWKFLIANRDELISFLLVSFLCLKSKKEFLIIIFFLCTGSLLATKSAGSGVEATCQTLETASAVRSSNVSLSSLKQLHKCNEIKSFEIFEQSSLFWKTFLQKPFQINMCHSPYFSSQIFFKQNFEINGTDAGV